MSRQHLKIRSGVLLKGQTSYPADPEDGDLVYRSDLYKYSIYRNANWADLLDDRQLSLLATTDSTTTGTLALMATTPTPYIRCTNASLVSLGGIIAPTAALNSQMIVLSNNTGVVISIVNNDTTQTAANRIYTGTSGVMTMLNQSSIILVYDATNSRWMVVSGSGGSTTLYVSVLTKTSGYTTVDGDGCIRCDATSAGFTLGLHAAAVVGTIVRIKKVDSSANIVTVDANASETIDGALTYPLATQYEELTLVRVSSTAWEIY